MKKFLRYAGIAALIGVVGISLTACGHHRDSPADKADWVVKKMTRKLDLNEDQQLKLRDVTDIFVDQRESHRSERSEQFEQVLAQVRKPELDKALLTQMVDNHQQRVAEVSPQVIDKLAIFHASLDDEQKEEIADRLMRFRKHHQDEG